MEECRICLTTDNQQDMVQPCQCIGSVRSAHLECLKSWCMENLSLKCEICDRVYKEEVVNALMATLLEAQDRQLARAGFEHLNSSNSQEWDAQGVNAVEAAEMARRARRGNVAILGIAQPGGGDTIVGTMPGNQAGRSAQELQAFLDELVAVHVRTTQQLVLILMIIHSVLHPLAASHLSLTYGSNEKDPVCVRASCARRVHPNSASVVVRAPCMS